jgi:ATP-binding cassette subfamily A (ABC1) protein 3
LLGPNGAGKTTTLMMLTGMQPVSSGAAAYAELNIFRQMSKTRERLGVCPQHDVLFERLTPREHLETFAAFKGRTDTAQIKRDVDEILEDIELKEVQDVLACNLSGGQQRKLSIGIAFIGKSDMIFLDEPTSGIDLAARPNVWKMLKKYKANKVIILTTHYMEEAEELGDRIGIMTSGTLRCVGDPLFLKSAYGVGYNLVVAREKVPEGGRRPEVDPIRDFILAHVPGTRLRRDTGQEAIYFLPKEQSKGFKDFFNTLDANLADLGIKSYGMTTSTLEEIFLLVAHEDDGEGAKLKYASESLKSGEAPPPSALDKYSITNEPEAGAVKQFGIHFWAILWKRMLITYRNWHTLLNELLVPVILILFGFLMTKIPTFFDGPVRWFESSCYPTPQSFIINSNRASGDGASAFTGYLEGDLRPLSLALSSTTDDAIIKELDTYIYEHRGVSPSRYGSMYLKTCDPANHLYEFVLFVNISSQDAAGAFMSYASQTLLRTVRKDPKLRLTFANAPLPLTYKTRNREEAKNGAIVSNTLVIAFALVPASVISFIVREREDSLKHQQLISGVSLTAYWLSNSVMDIVKSLVPCAIGIGLIFAFGVDLPYAWLLMLIFSFTIIPFTYATSFFFVRENIAQTTTLLLHFFAGVVLSPVFTIFRIFDNTRDAGRILGWILRIVPSFSLSYGISNIS